MPGEMVHHKNGNKADNRPENIEICRNHFEHKVHHRTTEGMRLPGEPNPIIECECGCGKTFKKYDPSNRPRRFVSGHNPPPPATAMDAVLEILKRGSAHRQVIADLCGKPVKNVGVALDRLRVKGLVIRVDRGVWALWEKNQK